MSASSSYSPYPLKGGCNCGKVRYRLETSPLIVHCCHCRWCQRETGSSYALNAMIESNRVVMTSPALPKMIMTPSESGKGQNIGRCPVCFVTLWSNYSGSRDVFRFIRVGTLDEPDRLPPDIHIYTSTKQPWVTLSGKIPVMKEYYDREKYWPAESLERHNAWRNEFQAVNAKLL